MTGRALVVGGGVAGPAAAVYLARAGLDTVVCDRGASSIRRCAHLGNYLGFPAGIDPETFLGLAHEQVRRAGGTFREETVTALAREGDGFRVETDEGSLAADYVVAATKYDASYLAPLLDGAVDDEGRTAVDGLYVAGPLAGRLDQAQVAAGDGVSVARSLVLDHLESRGHWPEAAACYVDWQTRERDHEPGWDEDFADWLRGTAPGDADPDRVERVVTEVVEREREAALTAGEARERARAGQRALLAALDEDLVGERLDG